jgi:hypothetical protein
MVDVFISYSRANQEVVRRLAEAVKRLGYDVWWDDELPPHRSYSEVITEKIAEAKAAIVVWSGGSIGSEWVRAEADLARNQKKLIQTSIDDCMPPMPFNQIQFASLAGWEGEDDHPGWIKVKGSLVALCGEGTDTRPVYALPESAPPTVPPTARAVPPVRPAPRRSSLVVSGVIAGSLAVIAVVGVLALTRGGNGVERTAAKPPIENVGRQTAAEPQPPPPPMATAPQTAPVRPETPAPRPVVAAQPQRQMTAMPMIPRGYCKGPGRGTPQCRQMMQRRMQMQRQMQMRRARGGY